MTVCQRICPFLVLFLLSACVAPRPRSDVKVTNEVSVSPSQIALLLPVDLKNKEGWAEDIYSAIEKAHRVPTSERVCATVAIIAQESGFQIDPPVKNLPEIVRLGLKKKFSRLGPFAGLAVKRILQTQIPGRQETFGKRISKLRTESDLDRLFRDIEKSIRKKYPVPAVAASIFSKLIGKGWLEDFNPVTTAGSMQVKVSFAKELDGMKHLSDSEVRDLLYTRKGGVRAGTARLLEYEASYEDMIYRFADYNSGMYSSRNAAFQSILSKLTHFSLVSDGDLLAYDADGSPSDTLTNSEKAMISFGEHHGISERAVKRSALEEKTKDFETTDIWTKARSAWEKRTGKPAIYAQIPDVTLDSLKLSSKRKTNWFSSSVHRRYETCCRKIPCSN